jgi:hypothetical protein
VEFWAFVPKSGSKVRIMSEMYRNLAFTEAMARRKEPVSHAGRMLIGNLERANPFLPNEAILRMSSILVYLC